jgi:hypothetical protein
MSFERGAGRGQGRGGAFSVYLEAKKSMVKY